MWEIKPIYMRYASVKLFKASFQANFCRQKLTSRHLQRSKNAAKRMDCRSKIDFAHVKTYVQVTSSLVSNLVPKST